MSGVLVCLSSHCGPSQQLSNLLNRTDELDNIAVELINKDADPARMKQLGLLAVPTTYVLDDSGGIIKTLVGYNINIINKIKEALNVT